MAIMGRPRKEITEKEFEKLCGLHCTKFEIAAWFDISEDTLERRVKEIYGETFAAVFAKKKGNGKVSLRRKQWLLADKNAAMAIFLGKNLLGQRDNLDQNLNHKGEIKLAYNLDKEPEE